MNAFSGKGIIIPPSAEERLVATRAKESHRTITRQKNGDHPRASDDVECGIDPASRKSNEVNYKEQHHNDGGYGRNITEEPKPKD